MKQKEIYIYGRKQRSMLLNKSRANDYMYKYGVDAIIAASPWNVSYLTGLDCWFYRSYKEFMLVPGGTNAMVPCFAVFPRDEEPTLITMKPFTMFATGLQVKDVRAYGASADDSPVSTNFLANLNPDEKRIYDFLVFGKKEGDAFQVLRSTIKDLGLEKSQIGLDCDDVTMDLRSPLSKLLPNATIKNCSQVLRFIRMVKSEEELKLLTKCAKINEKNGVGSLRLVKPEVRAGDLEQAFREGVAKEGASLEHFTHSRYGLGNSSDHRSQFKKGDVIVFDFGCIYNMYYSDGAATLSIGPFPSKLKRIYQAVRESIEQTIDIISPGVKSSTVLSTMAKTLSNSGIPNADKLFSVQGHGIGLEVRDYPIIAAGGKDTLSDEFMKASTDIPLEPGMVFNVEIGFSQTGLATIGFEKTVVVTKTGCAEIVPQKRDMPITIETN